MGGVKQKRYIEVMDWQAQKAQQLRQQTGQITVVVQDNGPVHCAKAVQQKWKEWNQQGLFSLFLPKYCSELNPIEGEWHQLKQHELAGRMFEDEVELVDAIIEGVDARGRQGGYLPERFMFI